MSNESEVEIRLEGQTHAGVQLFELPFQRFTSVHHDSFQRLLLMGRSVFEQIQHVIQRVKILFEQSQTGGVELRFFQLKDRQGDPKHEFVNFRFGWEQWQETRQTHDQRIDQIDVRKRFQGFDENAKQSFDFRVARRFGNAPVDDDRSRLQGRIELKSESLSEFLPLSQPFAVGNVVHTRFHQFEQRVSDRFQRG